MNLAKKLWNMSLAQVYCSLERRLAGTQPNPKWTTVSSGVLKDSKLFIDSEYFKGWKEMSEGTFDSFIYDQLESIENLQGKVFWDIGAHFGYHSLSFAALAGDKGQVFSFEPNPFNADRLKMHLDGNQNLKSRIKIHEIALSDSTGELEFKFSKNVDGSWSSGSHLSSVEAPLSQDHYESFESKLIKAETIDSMLVCGDLAPADIIKIDVEGAEKLVLDGGKQFFAQYKPILFIEVHNISMMFHCFKFLSENNYSLKLIDEVNTTLSKCFIYAYPTR